MPWELEHTDEFEEWLLSCDQDTQEAVVATFPLLRERGPELGRPFVGTLKGSRHSNMKELRATRTVRVCFAFDPRRTAILLVGADKAGRPEKRFYKQLIRKADKIYDQHLEAIDNG